MNGQIIKLTLEGLLFSKEASQKNTAYDAFAMKAKLRHDGISELQDLYPLGSTFDYMGVKCRVTHTYEIQPVSHYVAYYGFLHGSEAFPVLIADYVDSNGVVRELKLSYDEAKRLQR